ncbi:MAG: NADH-quinone oxidoreductase subunit J, partial [Candidatus Acidiferrales bacterium]
MSVAMLVFIVCGLFAVLGAVGLILAREPVHSALSLVLVMVALAVLYLLLGAAFIAAIQILVYAGAVMVLFVFVIMLLNAGVEVRTNLSHLARWVGLPLAILFLVEMTYALFHEYAARTALAAG